MVIITAHTMARDGAVLISALLGAKEIWCGGGCESHCKEAESEPSTLLLLPWSCTCDGLDTCSSPRRSLARARVQRCCLTPLSEARASPGQAEHCSAARGLYLAVPVRLLFLCCLSHLGAGQSSPALVQNTALLA